ncbi:MAG: serine hydrolase, partial [Sphingomicrobium sp.]
GGTIKPAGPHDYSYSWGGAGFRGTAPGVAMFGARVMQDGFLSPEARTAMWTPAQKNDGSPVVDGEDRIAFGWRIGMDADGQRIAHHAGVAIGARSALILYPESRESVSVLSNAVWVSDIKETAEMLVAPFRADPTGPQTPCPTWATKYSGSFGDKAVGGTARFVLSDGICRGKLGVAKAAGAWFDALPQDSTDNLPVISILPGNRLDRAALVTPSGTYDFRRHADGSFVAALSPSRKFVVRLQH